MDNNQNSKSMKFCKFCGEKIPADAVICTHCGRQVEETKKSEPNIVINNTNENKNTNGTPGGFYGVVGGIAKNKWVSLLLCFFIGVFGAHKFYEGKIGMGLLYLFTAGLFGIGVIVDFIVLLFKPNPYFV